eukprot:TRINITY_DN12946_c0_g1_i1.p1 TRINITY_DN12946_c0_g1~~TRINITY_DN12946_c0_g1_i1.p1  ORF type:complete len:338 (-),score=63.79 TRINITY_DN12946_c0_g1_i1:74-1087(-)
MVLDRHFRMQLLFFVYVALYCVFHVAMSLCTHTLRTEILLSLFLLIAFSFYSVWKSSVLDFAISVVLSFILTLSVLIFLNFHSTLPTSVTIPWAACTVLFQLGFVVACSLVKESFEFRIFREFPADEKSHDMKRTEFVLQALVKIDIVLTVVYSSTVMNFGFVVACSLVKESFEFRIFREFPADEKSHDMKRTEFVLQALVKIDIVLTVVYSSTVMNFVWQIVSSIALYCWSCLVSLFVERIPIPSCLMVWGVLCNVFNCVVILYFSWCDRVEIFAQFDLVPLILFVMFVIGRIVSTYFFCKVYRKIDEDNRRVGRESAFSSTATNAAPDQYGSVEF